MNKPTYEQARDLGARIYEERSSLASVPVIDGSAQHRRIEQLDCAARWNSIALMGLQ